jgi:hypothetical protein
LIRRFFAWSAWLPIESTSTCERAPEGIVATVPPGTGVEASAIVAKSGSTHEAVAPQPAAAAGFTSRAISSFGLQREARRRAHRQRAAVATPRFAAL